MKMYDETKLRALFCIAMNAQREQTEYQGLPKAMKSGNEGGAIAQKFNDANLAFDKYLKTGETQSIETVDWTLQT